MCVCVCVCVCLAYSLLRALWVGSVVLCLSLILESSQSLLLKIFLLLHSFFSISYYNYANVTSFEVVPQLLAVCSFFFHFFSLCILVWEISADLYSCCLILSSVVSSLLKNPLKPFFISITVFLFLKISFDCFLEFQSLWLHYSPVFFKFFLFSTFSIRALNIL